VDRSDHCVELLLDSVGIRESSRIRIVPQAEGWCRRNESVYSNHSESLTPVDNTPEAVFMGVKSYPRGGKSGVSDETNGRVGR